MCGGVGEARGRRNMRWGNARLDYVGGGQETGLMAWGEGGPSAPLPGIIFPGPLSAISSHSVRHACRWGYILLSAFFKCTGRCLQIYKMVLVILHGLFNVV